VKFETVSAELQGMHRALVQKQLKRIEEPGGQLPFQEQRAELQELVNHLRREIGSSTPLKPITGRT
jgi:hypothetical protein